MVYIMLKTNIKSYFVIGLASFIAFNVLLISLHSKDLVRYNDMSQARKITYTDLSEKAVKELHDHVDKQVLKSFSKSFSDGSVIASRNRDDFDATYEEDPGLWGRFHEQLMLWRVFVSLPFSQFVSRLAYDNV